MTATASTPVPERVQLKRTKGWRLPSSAVVVARPTRWGNPFRYRHFTGLARVPAAVGEGDWEYEGRMISGPGGRHDYIHEDGRVTVCHVRHMTRAEIVETYRRALTGDLSPSMRTAVPSGGFLQVTADDVRRDLAGRSLACWCPLPASPAEPDLCHAAVLLKVANQLPSTEQGNDYGGSSRF